MARNQFKNPGLTVVELLILAVIAGILASSSLPVISNTRLASQITQLHATLSLARSEAIRRNRSVTVCGSSKGNDCGGHWRDGWIVLVDDDLDGNIDEGDKVLSVHGGVSSGISLEYSQARVIYRSDGATESGVNGVFTLCDARGASNAAGLTIGSTGRLRRLPADAELKCPVSKR